MNIDPEEYMAAPCSCHHARRMHAHAFVYSPDTGKPIPNSRSIPCMVTSCLCRHFTLPIEDDLGGKPDENPILGPMMDERRRTSRDRQ